MRRLETLFYDGPFTWDTRGQVFLDRYDSKTVNELLVTVRVLTTVKDPACPTKAEINHPSTRHWPRINIFRSFVSSGASLPFISFEGEECLLIAVVVEGRDVTPSTKPRTCTSLLHHPQSG
jgi:hypothetical protein